MRGPRPGGSLDTQWDFAPPMSHLKPSQSFHLDTTTQDYRLTDSISMARLSCWET